MFAPAFRSMRTLMILSAVCCLCVATPARAGVKAGTDVPGGPDPVTVTGPRAAFLPAEVLIDFDDVSAPCVFVETTALRNAYLPLGVRFVGPDELGGGAILNSCSNFSVTGFSGANFLAFNSFSTLMGSGGVPTTPETLRFVSPVSDVSVLAGSSNGAGELVQLEAYNAAGGLVDQNSRTLAAAMQRMVSLTPAARAALGQRNFARVQQEFGFGAMVHAYRELYARALQGAPKQ